MTEVLELIAEQKVIAILRLADPARFLPVTRALVQGGITLVEFSLATPGAMAALRATALTLGARVCLGAGTVLDTATAEEAIAAGARYIIMPVLRPDVIAACRRLEIPCIAGAFTPTEMQQAWEQGADLIKVFPITALGPGYIGDVLAPLPHLRLVPTGGVTPDNAAAYLHAGAYAVAAGSSLMPRQAVASGDMDAITRLAARFRTRIRNAERPGRSPNQ